MVTVVFAVRQADGQTKAGLDLRRSPDLQPKEKLYGEAIFAALEAALLAIQQLDRQGKPFLPDEIARQAAIAAAREIHQGLRE